MTQDPDAVNPFWDFSLALYRRPGVESLCLALQDNHGVNVNLLLWSCWLETRTVTLDADLLAAAQRLVQDWDQRVVTPLRQARRAVRKGNWETPGPSLLAQCKRLELEAEQVQQQWLYQLAVSGERRPAEGAAKVAAVGENVEFFLAAAGVSPRRSAVELLAGGIQAIDRG
ncbi:TIGR02444 family protein [Exilibacterium tricleocarpae]|uniref:TIGR02444 family protein n=1 Tax=Exilibacterium tricleocarpae TaxID=2591008 RepID=A0A545TZ88_9GAMM|nr:TIGR02444 family protein [Exilibacterium tricleocarpae]TQV82524.1 TIGR02444 family protein [Exilibacterium tricleocarpae]